MTRNTWQGRLRGAPALALAAVVLSGSASKPRQVAVSDTLAFQGVTVVDVRDGRLLPGQTVVVVGSRIQTVGPAGRARVPASAILVDARGKYLIPGLWDMHVHVDRQAGRLYPLFIARGVTGIRELAQRFPGGADSFRLWQREVLEGRRVGPRSYGPSADLTNGGIEMKTADDVRRVVDSLKAAGMAFLKYHDDEGARDLFFAIAREARRAGLPLVGHVPASANAEAADSGLRSVEHMASQRQCWPDWIRPFDATRPATLERCALLAEAYKRNGTWLVPTLSASHTFQFNLEDARRVLRVLRRFGVTRLLAGTDTEDLMVGDELAYLVGAGLSPLEALQTATLNPARFLGATDSMGTVAAGKVADLVLLDANPLDDIRNVTTVRAVVANGRYFDRAALDGLAPAGARPAPTVDPVAALALPPRRAPARRTVVLRGVTVVDVREGRRLAGQTVVVAGNRIRAVGPASAVRIPAAARVIDAGGKYLIPGLWDMHADLDDPMRYNSVARHDSAYRGFLPRFLVHGVTGVRTLGPRFYAGVDSFWVWRRAIRDGRRVGPRLTGPSSDVVIRWPHFGRPDLALQAFTMALNDPDSVRGGQNMARLVAYLVDSLKAYGIASIAQEIYEGRTTFFATLREARRMGLPVLGPVPPGVTHAQAADSGVAAIEHLDRHECWAEWPATLDTAAAAARCAAVAAAYRRNGTWLIPTLLRAQQVDTNLADAQRVVRVLRRAGVTRFLAGSDVSLGHLAEAPAFRPGGSLVDEVVLLAEAGLSPLEALQAATLNPAQFFGATDSLGTVATGKLADLVLLDADPLADLGNLRRVRAVIADGRYYDHAALEGLRAQAERPRTGGRAAVERAPGARLSRTCDATSACSRTTR